MKNQYVSSLHKIEMSRERKEALVDMLTQEIETARSTPNMVEVPEKHDRRTRRPACFKVAAAAACVAAVIGGAGAAYAADLGGIQRTVQVWIHGDQTNATLVVEHGAYTLDYQDATGKAAHRGGGGVVMNPDGTERPATEEELLREINAPDVSYEDDGRVIVYYLGQALDVTDQFENGVCYVQLQVDGKTQYMTIKYQNGYAISPNSYVQPDKFN